MHPIRLALFDDHERLREGLISLLTAEPKFEIVASGRSKDDAISAAEGVLPDVMLLDVSMPGDGLICAREMTFNFPAVKIIVMTSDDSEQTVLSALSSGAVGFLDKGSSFRQIRQEILNVAEGYGYISPKLAELLLPVSGRGTPWFQSGELGDIPLTYREEQILSRLAQGLLPSEIGPSIGLETAVVAKMCANILRKLHDHAGRIS